MKILQLFSKYQERGGEEVAVARITGILRLRHEVEELIFDNTKLAGLHGVKKFLQPLLFMWNPSSLRAFKQSLATFSPDLIVIHNLFPAGSAALLQSAVNCGVPTIYYAHNFRPFSVNGYCWANGRVEPAGLKLDFWPEIRAASWQQSSLRTAFFAGILLVLHWCGTWRKIGGWIAISRFLRDRLIEGGLPEASIRTIYYPGGNTLLPLADGGEPCEQADRSPVPEFLFLGRLSEEKGVPVLLAAWKAYVQSGGNGNLTIGGGGPLEESLRKEPLADFRVRLAGHVSGEEKAELLRRCTALAVPSLWWEGFGLVVYEAYLNRKPVLASNSGGLNENVIDGETGWVHGAGSAMELCSHFHAAADQRGECARRGESGRRLLDTMGSAEVFLNNFERLAASLGR